MSNEAKHCVVRDKQTLVVGAPFQPSLIPGNHIKYCEGWQLLSGQGKLKPWVQFSAFYVLQNFLVANFHMLYFDNMTADKGSVFSTPLTVVP